MRGMYTVSITQQEVYRSPQGDVLKVLFVNPDAFHVEQKAAIPLGLLSIATYLERHGHQVRVYDRAVEGGSIKPHLARFFSGYCSCVRHRYEEFSGRDSHL
jgi:hypothetical protein